jgi:phage-related protein
MPDHEEDIIELLPCPFCGGKGKPVEINTGNCCWIYRVDCEDCDIHGPEVNVKSTDHILEHIKMAKFSKKLWNKRS